MPRMVDPSCPTDSFFDEAFFDFIPFDEYDASDPIPASCLHLSGYGNDWMAQYSGHGFFDACNPFDDDLSDVDDFHSACAFEDDHSIESTPSLLLPDDDDSTVASSTTMGEGI